MESKIRFNQCVFLIFMTLKLLNKLDWSWWWITAPIWIAFLIDVFVLMAGSKNVKS